MINNLAWKLIVNLVCQNLNCLVNSFRSIFIIVLLSGQLNKTDFGWQLSNVDKEKVFRACLWIRRVLGLVHNSWSSVVYNESSWFYFCQFQRRKKFLSVFNTHSIIMNCEDCLLNFRFRCSVCIVHHLSDHHTEDGFLSDGNAFHRGFHVVRESLENREKLWRNVVKNSVLIFLLLQFISENALNFLHMFLILIILRKLRENWKLKGNTVVSSEFSFCLLLKISVVFA